MISTKKWASVLVDAGYNFSAGVPCSSLGGLQGYFQGSPDISYVAAPNEGIAVAVAAGAVMTGRKSLVLMQNSGLGNAVNPLTSLVETFDLPMLLISSWRGRPSVKDEPQHFRMGQATHAILDAMNIPWFTVGGDEKTANTTLQDAIEMSEVQRRCVALVVPDGTFDRIETLEPSVPNTPAGKYTSFLEEGPSLSRSAFLEWMVSQYNQSSLKITTTGKTGRELFAIDDQPANLYVVGSMGLASSVGLGISTSTNQQVVVIDGDGAALMHLGALPMIASYKPTKLVHFVLDNGCYDSTGAQPSISVNAPFAEIAAACGYASTVTVDSLLGLHKFLLMNAEGPQLVHVKICPGSMSPLPRPSLSPVEVLTRLQRHFGFDGSVNYLENHIQNPTGASR